MRRLLIGALAASAAIATMLIGSATAVSATHTVEVGDTGSLLAKGAGVIVPVTVTCDPSTTPPFPFPPFPGASPLTVSATQRSGNRIAQGGGSTTVVCDGTPQTVDVRITASQAPFKHGPALVTASFFHCDETGCHVATDTEEVTFTK